MTVPGYHWAERARKDWDAIPKEERYTSGLAFNPMNGQNSTIISMVQDRLKHGIVNWEMITTYTWRRPAETVALKAEMSASELVALSDWTDKSKADRKEAMPLRYADGKQILTRKTKFMVWLYLKGLTACDDWDVIPVDYWKDARESKRFKEDLQHAMDNDAIKIFEAEKGILPKALEKSGFTRRDEASQSIVPHNRPGQTEVKNVYDIPRPFVKGLSLSERMNDNEQICPFFQVDICPLDEKCPLKHGCAAMCNNGRICGLHHAA